MRPLRNVLSASYFSNFHFKVRRKTGDKHCAAQQEQHSVSASSGDAIEPNAFARCSGPELAFQPIRQLINLVCSFNDAKLFAINKMQDGTYLIWFRSKRPYGVQVNVDEFPEIIASQRNNPGH